MGEESDRQERVAALRARLPLPAHDLRTRLQELAARQQRFQRFLAADLQVDEAGLDTMDRLITGGAATPSELARAIERSTAAMSLVLNRLEAAGHVRRDRHPSDGRKLVVTAAAESVDRAYDRLLPLIDGIEAIADSLSPAERAVVDAFLDRLLAVYDVATGPVH